MNAILMSILGVCTILVLIITGICFIGILVQEKKKIPIVCFIIFAILSCVLMSIICSF